MKEKTKKLRGHKTDGHGGMKRGRGKGERGGTGRAGAGKHKRVSLKAQWGRHGFHRHALTRSKKTINVEDLNSFEGEVNLGELGYEKLLGSGYVKKPLKVTVKEATPRAVEKITAAGGEVITG
ncbi:MAG TPA: 50S ribosomal protein L15 [Thermoplasmatales archaeon]|nr:MAG: 50S ribosomal protein L15 [Thermoplasmata archaeon]RLF34270.1 MAG: 50S ribosomal protein L15 [Thermoplasmata archaeon]HDN51182.1 50S ribosomal protein L15 [Thermoplasmatales archaeon]